MTLSSEAVLCRHQLCLGGVCVSAVFNVGEYRRRVVTNFTNSAHFFHPDNIEANAIRELVINARHDLVFLSAVFLIVL